MDFEDPVLTEKIETAIERGIDKSIPASQRTLKVASAIGPVFAVRAIDEIKDIQKTIRIQV